MLQNRFGMAVLLSHFFDDPAALSTRIVSRKQTSVLFFFLSPRSSSSCRALTYREQYPLHVVPEEAHGDEQKGGQEGTPSERDAHQACFFRSECLRAQHVDSRAHSVENAAGGGARTRKTCTASKRRRRGAEDKIRPGLFISRWRCIHITLSTSVWRGLSYFRCCVQRTSAYSS